MQTQSPPRVSRRRPLPPALPPLPAHPTHAETAALISAHLQKPDRRLCWYTLTRLIQLHPSACTQPSTPTTPSLLSTAVDACELQAVSLLLARGAVPEPALLLQATVSAPGAVSGDIVRMLLLHGADPDGDGVSPPPVWVAAFCGNAHIVKLLVHAHCDVARTGGGGETALHVAAVAGLLEAVECLVEAGAEIQRKAFNGLTALDYAKEGCCEEVVTYLKDQMKARGTVLKDRAAE